MRAVVQRVSRASVEVDGEVIGAIDRGYLVLAAIGRDDTDDTLRWMARKVATLRIFGDEEGRMSVGLDGVDGCVLVVSQFTLYGNVGKGTRPSFDRSAPPEVAREMFDRFVEYLREELPGRVETGSFQAMMTVSLVNDGPVTIVIEK